ncbi:hypothetical protein D3C85_1802110 [compost metagenome]
MSNHICSFSVIFFTTSKLPGSVSRLLACDLSLVSCSFQTLLMAFVVFCSNRGRFGNTVML